LREQNPQVLAHLDHVLSVFAKALASTKKEDGSDVFYPNGDAQISAENKQRIVELVKALAASQPEKVQQAGLAPYLA
jgi:hypothetical protein